MPGGLLKVEFINCSVQYLRLKQEGMSDADAADEVAVRMLADLQEKQAAEASVLARLIAEQVCTSFCQSSA